MPVPVLGEFVFSVAVLVFLFVGFHVLTHTLALYSCCFVCILSPVFLLVHDGRNAAT